MRFGKPLFLAMALCSLVPGADGGCILIPFTIEGEVVGETADKPTVVVVRAIADDGTHQETTREVSRGSYSVSVSFDTYKSYSSWRGHDCSRALEAVEVALLGGGHELDKVRLSIINDFELRDGILHFRLRKPLVLYAKRKLEECNPVLQRRQDLPAKDLPLSPLGYKRPPYLTYTIQADGSVNDVRFVNGSGSSSLDEYVLEWVRAFKYDARPECPPIYTSVVIRVHFR